MSDDGHGISADVLPRIFEPHFSTRTSGSGLGLAISRQLVEGWGGTITVREPERRAAYRWTPRCDRDDRPTRRGDPGRAYSVALPEAVAAPRMRTVFTFTNSCMPKEDSSRP